MARKRRAKSKSFVPRKSPKTASTKAYVYETLLPEQIRLLVLSPGEDNDPLRGNLEVWDIADEPKYKAISYAWGTPMFTRTLDLPQRHLAITESLLGALKCFRSATEPLRLWADAICIDQNNTVEKNQQVYRMHEIYEQAEEVLAWLGGPQKSECLVYYLLNVMAENHWAYRPDSTVDGVPEPLMNAHHKLLRSSAESPQLKICSQCHKSYRVHGGEASRRAMRSFADRPWFTRLWVIQEVFCAKRYTVHFGHHSVNSQILSRANSGAKWPGFGLEEDIKKVPPRYIKMFPRLPMITIMASTFRSRGKPCMLWMIFNTQHAFPKIPHDMVFAVRRLANTQSSELLAPDYDLPIEDLWKRVAIVELCAPIDDIEERRHVPSSSGMAVLALAGLQKKWQQAHEPSWVADLGNLTYECKRKWYSYEFWYRRHGIPSGCWAGGKSVNTATIDKSLNVISIRGKPLDHVEAICTRPQNTSRHYSVIPDLNEMTPWLTPYLAFIRSRTGLKSVNVITLSQLMLQSDDLCGRHRYNYEKYRGTEVSTRSKQSNLRGMRTMAGLLSNAGYYCTERFDKARLLATTSSGYLGWIPEDSKAGDVVVLFQYAPYPFVLRKRPDGFYTLIGDAYIQGVMDGEAWPEDNETEVEWIKIK